MRRRSPREDESFPGVRLTAAPRSANVDGEVKPRRQPRVARWAATVAAMAMAVGCASESHAPTPTPVRKGPLPTGCLPSNYPIGPACRFPSGRLCPAHAACGCDDVCNACSCGEGPNGELALGSTLVGCAKRVVGCDQVLAWDCQLPSGRWCADSALEDARGGIKCLADDGCNICRCNPDATLDCTTNTCAPKTDGVCRTVADCPPGPSRQCAATGVGCGLALRCTTAPSAPSDDSFGWFCGCDGRSGFAWGDLPEIPYANKGRCADDPPASGDLCLYDSDCAPMRCQHPYGSRAGSCG